MVSILHVFVYGRKITRPPTSASVSSLDNGYDCQQLFFSLVKNDSNNCFLLYSAEVDFHSETKFYDYISDVYIAPCHVTLCF